MMWYNVYCADFIVLILSDTKEIVLTTLAVLCILDQKKAFIIISACSKWVHARNPSYITGTDRHSTVLSFNSFQAIRVFVGIFY
jgi:hypothetical protein